MGLLEEREAAARVRVEELRAEVDRVLAELGAAEAVLERRVIARVELAEVLAAPGDPVAVCVQEAPDPDPALVAAAARVPVAGSIVPRFGEGMTVQALAPDYRRIVELLESAPCGGEGVSAKELTAGLALEMVPAKVEGAVQGEAPGRAGMADGVAVGPVHTRAVHRDCCGRGREAGRARRRLMSVACEK